MPLRTDILQKTVVECPSHFCHLLPTCIVCPLAIPEFCAHNISLRLLEDHSLACVQTSPLPRFFSEGGGTSVHRPSLAVSFFIDSRDCFSPQFQTPLHLCVAVNSLYSGHCRDLELESSLSESR